MARLQRPPALPEDASPALADLLSRMTALDPVHRPPAHDVAAALREQLVGRVTAPDAAQTAPTPIAGLAAAPLPPRHPDATLPQEPLLTPSRGMPLSGPIAVPRTRKRFPTVLAVAATALAATVAGVAISAASNLSTSEVAGDTTRPSTSASAPVAAQPEQQQANVGAPVDLSGGGRTTPSTSGSPTPKPSTSSPTPTPTTGGTTPPATPSSTPASTPPVEDVAPSTEPSTVDPAPEPTGEAPSSEPADPASTPAVDQPVIDAAA